MFQKVWQFDADSNPDHKGPDTHLIWLRVFDVWRWLLFAFANHGALLQKQRFVWLLPIANCRRNCFVDFRLYDQLVEDSVGLAQKPEQQVDARICIDFAQEKFFDIRSCESKCAKFWFFQFFCGVISYAEECLTNLLERCRNCLQTIGHLYFQLQPIFRSFGTP